MTERERLAELIAECIAIRECSFAEDKRPTCDDLAGYLIANGVVCPPCKVGDTVWMQKNQIERWKVASIEKTPNDIRIGLKPTSRSPVIYVSVRYFGDFIFLTREAAKAALAERRKA